MDYVNRTYVPNLKSFNIANNTGLTYLNITGTKLETFIGTNLVNLTSLYLYDNSLNTIDISTMSNLVTMRLENNFIRDITVGEVVPAPTTFRLKDNCLREDRLDPDFLVPWLNSKATDDWTILQPSGCPDTACEGALDVSTEECEALVNIYGNTGGTGWNYHLGWNTYYHIGQWYGVTLTEDKKNVNTLKLDANNLTGNFGFTIGNLDFLETLELYDNTLTAFSND